MVLPFSSINYIDFNDVVVYSDPFNSKISNLAIQLFDKMKQAKTSIQLPTQPLDRNSDVPEIAGFKYIGNEDYECPVIVNKKQQEIIKCTVAEYQHIQTGIDMVLLPPLKSSVPERTGLFPNNIKYQMGEGSNKHEVKLSPFLIAKTLTTQKQWDLIKSKADLTDEREWNGANLTIERVNWHDCTAFCKFVGLQLPSEAQWEYACRAGTTTEFYFGDSLSSKQANFDGNYPYGNAEIGVYQEKTTAVGFFQPNAFGLFDMHGNLWEWCEDDYDDEFWSSYQAKQLNPICSVGAYSRILRGGSWGDHGYDCRSAYRNYGGADVRNHHIGFRCVFSFEELK